MAAIEQHLRGLLRAGAEEQREYRQQFSLLKERVLKHSWLNGQRKRDIKDANDVVELCNICATDFDLKRVLVRQLNITGDFDILKKIVRPSGDFVRPDDIFACGENKPELKASSTDLQEYRSLLSPEDEDQIYLEQLGKLKIRLSASDLIDDITKGLIEDCNGLSQPLRAMEC